MFSLIIQYLNGKNTPFIFLIIFRSNNLLCSYQSIINLSWLEAPVSKLSHNKRYVVTYVVPDNRKGVRTPSTSTMFFTPGRASVFLLFVWTERKRKQYNNNRLWQLWANLRNQFSIILIPPRENSFAQLLSRWINKQNLRCSAHILISVIPTRLQSGFLCEDKWYHLE